MSNSVELYNLEKLRKARKTLDSMLRCRSENMNFLEGTSSSIIQLFDSVSSEFDKYREPGIGGTIKLSDEYLYALVDDPDTLYNRLVETECIDLQNELNKAIVSGDLIPNRDNEIQVFWTYRDSHHSGRFGHWLLLEDSALSFSLIDCYRQLDGEKESIQSGLDHNYIYPYKVPKNRL